MAAHVPVPPTITRFQKPGTRVFSGLEECALSHFRAISLLARCFRSCYGPAGGRKFLVPQPGLATVIGNFRAVLPKLEIEHPAGILARQACGAQEQECGDGTNTVLQLAGALMAEAKILLRRGMPASDLCVGYRLACAHACRKLEELSFNPWENWPRWADPSTHLNKVAKAANTDECEDTGMTSPPSSCEPASGNGLVSGQQPWRASLVPVSLCGAMLQYSLASTVSDPIFQLNKETLQGLVDWACTLPKDGEPETMEVLGFTGGALEDSWVFKGAIMQLEPLGTRMRVTDARLAVYVCPFGERKTRVSCTTLIEDARVLVTLRAGIERVEEERIEALRQVGVTVLAVAGAVSELALHFCNHAEILVVKLDRRSQARQLALASGARALTTDRAPEYGELGKCQRVYPSEIGGLLVMAFESCMQDPRPKGLITVVVRGSTPELVNYAKESMKAALRLFTGLREDPRMVAGAGATDIHLVIELEKSGRHLPFPKQQGFLAFARALECLPQALAGNWGLDVASVLGDLRARHEMGETNVGVEENGTTPTEVIDSFTVKKRALELATDVAMTLIGCGQVVVAKKSGGPSFRKENRNWDLEPDFVD